MGHNPGNWTMTSTNGQVILDWLASQRPAMLALLEELGFGLDLASCAATGGITDLVYVSPKSGRAVSAAAGEPYKGRLLAHGTTTCLIFES